MSKGKNWCLVFVYLFLFLTDMSVFAVVTIPSGIMRNRFFVRVWESIVRKITTDIVISASFYSTCNNTLQLLEHSVQQNVSDSTEQADLLIETHEAFQEKRFSNNFTIAVNRRHTIAAWLNKMSRTKPQIKCRAPSICVNTDWKQYLLASLKPHLKCLLLRQTFRKLPRHSKR